VRLLRQIYHRLLPARARQALTPLTTSVMQHLYRPQTGPVTDLAGVTVVGLFSSACGLGEAARLHANALQAAGLLVERLDLSPILDSAPSLPPPFTGPALGQGPVIVHLNPPLFRNALRMIGRRRLRGRKVIANWNWELERVPESWRAGANKAHEIWAPSQFTADAITRVLNRPVRVVPYPVSASQVPANRAAFGLPERGFVALTFVDLKSNMSRKNPLAAIGAFARAAADPAMPPCCLVIKLSGVAEHPDQASRVRRAIEACPARVVVLEQRLSKEARDTLVASADVLLSLHRSEGFGLTLAEAMSAGKRTIGTAWSGNMEFMTAENAILVPAELVPVQDEGGFYDPNLRWAEPDVAQAADALVRAATLAAPPPPALDLTGRFLQAVTASPAIAELDA
jgi:glycosyltransferase involved in cell wall biosynthesis